MHVYSANNLIYTNHASPNVDAYPAGFQQLKCLDYLSLLDDNIPTNISPVNPSGTSSYDNIWISNTTYHSRYTGRCGVIRRGLQHPSIVGKKSHLSGTVSDHCPVWAAFNY